MKRLVFVFFLSVALFSNLYAGGLMTNTNYHIAFDRMFARGATSEIDAIYSNPAGLAWGHEGWQFSLNFQKPWQNRDITTTYPMFQQMYGDATHEFEGKASVPIVPALFASYKKGRWSLAAMIGIVGSGGFVKYEEGIPMFNVMTMGKIYQQTATLPTGPITPDMYTIDSNVKGKQYIYGGQLNFAYKILDCLSAAVGVRANYYDGYSRGFVTATTKPELGGIQLMDLNLNVIQRGWGFTPILSVDYHKGPLTIGVKYEFRTKISTDNNTKALNVTMNGQTTDILAMANQYGNEATLQAITASMGQGMADKIKDFMPNEKVRYDMPALLTAAVQYEFTPKLRAALEYHFFDDKHAKMANDRQKELTHGTHEFLAGVEYDINKTFTVSLGGQRTDYGLSEGYQSNTSFACDSYSIGAGTAINLNERLRLNVSYFCSLYSDYTVESSNYLGTGLSGKDVYSRTNHVIGLGIDYKF